MRMSSPFRLFFAVVFSLTLVDTGAQDTTQHITANRRNAASQLNKPYLILISADGFRYDYAKKYSAKNLHRLSENGVRAASMLPSFPSVTYPNHYSIATGMYPSHHGLVYNEFYDRNRKATYKVADRKAVEDGSWYGGIPLWVLAEQQGMLSASYHFVGTEAAIAGVYPTYWYRYNSRNGAGHFTRTVTNWLTLPDSVRPHLITLYLSNTDDAGHKYGPESAETAKAVHYIDSVLGVLIAALEPLKLPVNYVFVSDHGMAAVDQQQTLSISAITDTSKFIVRGGNTSQHLYARNAADILPEYAKLKANEKDYKVYLRSNTPRRWHYDIGDDTMGRIGDIFLVPVYPKVFAEAGSKVSPGAHGFDPAMKEMHASFYAWGPAFKRKDIPAFVNVHVYPMVCSLLGLTYQHSIDGDPSVLKRILRK